jgi:hypothetical protein
MLVTFYPHLMATTSPVGRDLDWPTLVRALSDFRFVAGDKDLRRRSCPLWSPVQLTAPRRLNRNVSAVSCLVLDYDDGISLFDAAIRWEGYRMHGYTTWSHTADAPRCRVVLPLASPIPGPMWTPVYRDILGRQGLEADPQCIDPSRAFYLPAIGAGGPHSVHTVDGDLLDLSTAAADAHKRAEAEKARIESRRRANLDRVRRDVDNQGDAEKAAAKILALDPDARLALAESVGADVVTLGAGSIMARRAPCPQCGGAEVWWSIDRGWARCNHANSCGYAAPLYDYARGVIGG